LAIIDTFGALTFISQLLIKGVSDDTKINPFHVIEEMMKLYPIEALRKDKCNNTPLSWAAEEKHFKLIAFMASYNPNPIYAFMTVELRRRFSDCREFFHIINPKRFFRIDAVF